ncbi:sensor domain-containing protein [Megalodesulfovibrio gigas]|nr:sensor domain-containing diguanylate cyclase [Megalodesulfovibrio gigas]
MRPAKQDTQPGDDAACPLALRQVDQLKAQVAQLQAQVDRLTREKITSLDALEDAVLLGVFRPDADDIDGMQHIISQTLEKLGALLPFEAMAMYLVQEEDASFQLAQCEPASMRDLMERETDSLIEDNAFAWALSARKPRLLSARHVPGRLFLHPLATASRIRGMFVGLLDPTLSGLQDMNHSLASILLLSSAAAIESFEVYAYIKSINRSLESNVARLADSERDLIDHRTQLQQEVEARTADLSLEIQERRKAQRALQLERDFIQTIFETAGALIAVLDVTGRLKHCNHAFEVITGYQTSELKDRPFQELLAFQDAGNFFAASLRRLAQHGDVLREELPVRTRTGARRHVSWSFTAMSAGDGEAVGHVIATGMDMTEKRSAEDALRDSEARFRAMFTEAGMGIALFDVSGFCLDANPCLAGMLKRPPHELPGTLLARYAHPADASLLAGAIKELFNEPGTTRRLDMRFVDCEGRRLWTQCALSLVVARGGRTAYGFAIIEDVTRRHEMEEALRSAEATYRTIFENAVEGIFQAGLEGGFHRINPAMAIMFGYPSPAMMAAEVPQALELLCTRPEARAALLEQLATQGHVANHEMEARHRDGRTIWISVSARALMDETRTLRYLEGLAEDITERKACELILHQKATLDELTGIPNRYQFMERFEQLLTQSRRLKQPLAVLYIDLDGFKQVNDTHGHHTGDQVLAEVARRLGERVRKSDFAARLGGDEFAVLLLGSAVWEDIFHVCQSIIQAVTKPYLPPALGGEQECRIGASIGVSLFPEHGSDTETLLRKADVAMYRAKQHGGNTVHLFADPVQPFRND